MKYSTLEFSVGENQNGFIFDIGSLYIHLESLADKRDPKGVRYPLVAVLVMVILSKLAGENEPRGIAEWVRLRKDMLIAALALSRPTVPHPTTYSRILGHAVDVEELQQVASLFLTSQPRAGVSIEVAMDGKSLRGTIPIGQKQGVHLLAAYLPKEGIVLMQVEVDSKENEIVAAPRLIKSIDLQGKIVTGDAMFAQRELSKQIIEAGGDYLWSVKDNQPTLREEIEAVFTIEEGKTNLKAMTTDFAQAETVDKGHGRIEQRRITVTSMLCGHSDWPNLEQVFKLEREVEELSTGKHRQETVYGVTSLTREQANASRLMGLIRGHWGIENGLHYRKDKTLREDECRLRTGQAAQVMAVINNLVIGLAFRQGFKNLPEARRRYNAYPLEALELILRCRN